MSNIPDTYERWQAHESQLEEDLNNLPTCDWCGEHIQDDCYYDINGDKVCEHCIKECRRYPWKE